MQTTNVHFGYHEGCVNEMKVLVYGTGKVADKWMHVVKNTTDIEISCFVESSKTKNLFYEKPVYNLDEVDLSAYDYILVAAHAVDDIKYSLYRRQAPFEKVIFLTQVWIPAEVENKTFKLRLNDVSMKPGSMSLQIQAHAVFSTSREIYEILKMAPIETFWESLPEFNTVDGSSLNARGMKNILDRSFLPNVKMSDTVCDLACASGEWGRYISSKCKSVEGVDISLSMVQKAKDLSRKWGFSNCTYRAENLLEMKIGGVTYDHVMMLGLLTCVESDEEAIKIVKKVNRMMPIGGYLAVRDTLNLYNDCTLYYTAAWWYGKPISAVYRDLHRYEQFYLENGFSMCAEDYLHAYAHSPIEHGSHAYVFRKEKECEL